MSKTETPWECKPRTKAKLEIVKTYLSAWFGILALKGYRHVIYIDGFCGPGEYLGGEEGSPVIAARLASATAQKFPGFRATLIFIDQDVNALNHLQSIDAIKGLHSNIKIDVKQGDYSKELESTMTYLKENPTSPTFSFIDPFGFGQSPFEEIRHLMHNDHSELLINFWVGFMNRFKRHPHEGVIQKIKGMVGSDNLTPIINAKDPIKEFCEEFEGNLKQVGRFTLKFMMRDEGNIRDNAFFFCGKHRRGFEKIKEAMWKVDPVQGNSFSAHSGAKAKSNGQTNLFDTFKARDQIAELGEILLGQFKGRSGLPVKDISNWTIEETESFLPTHARKSLEWLFENNKTTFIDPEGRKRRAGTWPDRLLVTFV